MNKRESGAKIYEYPSGEIRTTKDAENLSTEIPPENKLPQSKEEITIISKAKDYESFLQKIESAGLVIPDGAKEIDINIDGTPAKLNVEANGDFGVVTGTPEGFFGSKDNEEDLAAYFYKKLSQA